MKKIYLSYGFAEGPWHAKQLIKLLISHGHEVTKDLKVADTILTHSGGAYLVPATGSQLIVIVGPTFWDGKRLYKSFAQNIGHGYKLFANEKTRTAWLKKMWWHNFYLLTRPIQIIRMYYGWKHKEQWFDKLNKTKRGAIVVRNNSDAFCSPNITDILDKDIIYKDFSGYHDDLWVNSSKYVGLLG